MKHSLLIATLVLSTYQYVYGQDPSNEISQSVPSQHMVQNGSPINGLRLQPSTDLTVLTLPQLRSFAVDTRTQLAMLLAHHQTGEAAIIRHQPVQSQSSSSSDIRASTRDVQSLFGGVLYSRDRSSEHTETHRAESVSYYNDGLTTQRIKLQIFDVESIEKFRDQLIKARDKDPNGFASKHLLNILERLLGGEERGEILSTRNISKVLGHQLSDYVATMNELKRRSSSGDSSNEPSSSEIRDVIDWGARTELEFIVLELNPARVGTSEFSIENMKATPIDPRQNRNDFEWKGLFRKRPVKSLNPDIKTQSIYGDTDIWVRTEVSTTPAAAAWYTEKPRHGSESKVHLIDDNFQMSPSVAFPGNGRIGDRRSLVSGSFHNLQYTTPVVDLSYAKSCQRLLRELNGTQTPKGIDLFSIADTKVFTVLPLHGVP